MPATQSPSAVAQILPPSAAAAQRLIGDSIALGMLEAFPGPAFVLDSDRRIVRANSRCSDLFRLKSSFVGQRPGEAIGCLAAQHGEGGCGATPACQTCGANLAILQAQATGRQKVDQWRVRFGGDAALDLLVCATPLSAEVGDLVLIAVQDVSAANRLQAFEHAIRDRVLEVATGLAGLTEILGQAGSQDLPTVHREVEVLAHELLQELQLGLGQAEGGQLEPRPGVVDAPTLLADLAAFVEDRFDDAVVHIPRLHAPHTLSTDPLMLRQVLRALVENAAEASAPGKAVTLGFEARPTPTFTVHSWTAIPPSMQPRVFQRGYSRKSRPGAGTGCYIAKLFTERYLQGKIDFHSDEHNGTRFRVQLPKEMSGAQERT